ncbi:PepSY domain-containing protein [Azospirillum sp. TSO35-2]|uniref:PepSY domain-containing protein n=1 Tax=Azospirillum sp. TSO35-2 TaxID=716796 RepID=UPI000D61AA57|nr:PepSY domain-containing protein [Azospirillum sp. TSO35-2]PWC37602.1 hypothetical protein TSO352_08700 [Azospirillum sp. TSO35-2]
MRTTLCLAVLAATLAAAPVAMAQGTSTGSRNDGTEPPMQKSTSSSGTSQAPVIDSLPGNQNDPWHDMNARPGTKPDRAVKHRAQSGSTGGSKDRAASGSSYSDSGRRTSSDASVTGRRGRGQKPLELQQTTLLNQLSAAGYSAVRDFRKDGDRYVASAMDQKGQWSTVVLDPHTGSIAPRR